MDPFCRLFIAENWFSEPPNFRTFTTRIKKRRTLSFCILTTLSFIEKGSTYDQQKATEKIFHLSAISLFLLYSFRNGIELKMTCQTAILQIAPRGVKKS